MDVTVKLIPKIIKKTKNKKKKKETSFDLESSDDDWEVFDKTKEKKDFQKKLK